MCIYSLQVLKLSEKSLFLNLENEFKHFSILSVVNISLRSSSDYQDLCKINTKTRDYHPEKLCHLYIAQTFTKLSLKET